MEARLPNHIAFTSASDTNDNNIKREKNFWMGGGMSVLQDIAQNV